MKVINLIVCLFLLLLSSCNWFTHKPAEVKPKDDLTQLPPETQEGKNTFGCLVNGQVWRNQGSGAYNLSAVYSNFSKSFSIEAIKKTNPLKETITIAVIEGFKGKGLYYLNTEKIGASFILRNEQNVCVYYTDSLNTGILEITRFDSIAPYIVSGRFSFTVATPGCDTIRVTDGRFDVSRN